MKKTLILNNKAFIYLGIVVILLTSCVSREKIAYYQDIDGKSIKNKSFQTTIQPEDLLMIIVSAQDAIAAAPYNIIDENGVTTHAPYLVDINGYVNLPTIGKIKVANKTKEEIRNELYSIVSKGIKNPVISIRIMNFKVTVLGEVRQPGIHKIISERITLPEALSLSGDLTQYGKRNNILITREVGTNVESQRVDITRVDFMNSEYYYLKQNDVIYVEPNKTMVKSSAVGNNISIYLTVASLLISTLAIILTNSK